MLVELLFTGAVLGSFLGWLFIIPMALVLLIKLKYSEYLNANPIGQRLNQIAVSLIGGGVVEWLKRGLGLDEERRRSHTMQARQSYAPPPSPETTGSDLSSFEFPHWGKDVSPTTPRV